MAPYYNFPEDPWELIHSTLHFTKAVRTFLQLYKLEEGSRNAYVLQVPQIIFMLKKHREKMYLEAECCDVKKAVVYSSNGKKKKIRGGW